MRASSPFFGCAAALFLSTNVLAGDFERLVMPGPVIQGHAEVESECSRCHRPFHSDAERGLCLECHEEVASDLEAGSGFHGRSPRAGKARCRSCHSEHQGRDFDAVGLNPDAFDHTQTDYPLQGAHRLAPCEACHAAGKKLREVPGRCFDCHREQDAHDGHLGERCEDCHTEASWAEARFDHDATRFPLVGAHRDAACVLCHPAEHFTKVALDCNGCHRLDDAHRGEFGIRCDSCHTPEGWKSLRFDHGRDTKYPLRGRHRQVKCESCHKQGPYEKKLPMDCVSCHAADDGHRGQNGRDCDKCHRERGWRETIFDHERDTKFPLRGSHRDVECRQCHPGRIYEDKVPTDCGPCHEADDVHRSQQGPRCERCHNVRSWLDEVFFDHDLTRFPLLGIHAVTSCDQCHASHRFKDAHLECVRCHTNDDAHEGRLGSGCARCHNPNAWPVWRFDHDADTSFPLRGGHEGPPCYRCHRTRVEEGIRLSKRCYSCHAADDTHFGAFGKACERCHGDETWRDAEVVR